MDEKRNQYNQTLKKYWYSLRGSSENKCSLAKKCRPAVYTSYINREFKIYDSSEIVAQNCKFKFFNLFLHYVSLFNF